MRYVIASSQCEWLLTTKESWEETEDDYLSLRYEFEASSWKEAQKIFDKRTNISACITKKEE